MHKSPYKFLDSYSKEDRDIFFGRDKEIDELYSRIFDSKILIVYGTSGTGKSSLINCGLANKFNDSDWLPVTVRRGTDINQSFYDSLDRTALTEFSSKGRTPAGGKTNDILKIIRSIYLDHFKPVYLIFDQFEELFIFGNSREKEELIINIKKVIDSGLQCRFIFSIREEYLAGLTEFEKIIPSFLTNRVRIEKMTRQNAIRVIEGPCHLNQIEIEPGFPEMLLDKLNPDNPDVELTWLQVYLDKVLRLASRDVNKVTRISKELLDKAGDVKDLLGSFLEEQISQLDDPEPGLVILKSFVSVKGTKHQITEEEVVEYSKTLGKEIVGETVKELIQRFIRLRILRDKDENGRYELRHDSLAAKIYEKITLVEKELLEVKQILENAYGSFEKRQLYLTPEDLNYIAPYEDKLILNEKITRFISQSKWSIHKARRRRQNILASVATVIIIILSFFTLWALRERANAIEQQMLADKQKNTAERLRETADSASLEAKKSRDIAVERESQAVKAQLQSDEASKVALTERENALRQKEIADSLSITANEQARMATKEKLKADSARLKAVLAEGKARELSFLSIAQNLALKSAGIENDPQLMGLLAVQAYKFNKKNNGRPEDPIIYEALNRAYSILDSSRHSVFTGSRNEIRVLREREDGSLLSADMDGQFRIWNPVGVARNLFTLPFRSPLNFIGSNSTGEQIITQHDDLNLFLWDAMALNSDNPTSQALNGHKSFVHFIAYTKDEKLLATAGRDSTVIIWDTEVHPALKINSVQTRSGVRALIFYSPDELTVALEDGSIILWKIKQNEIATIFASGTEKPLCLAWNDNKKVLIAGCANGNLLQFKLTDGNFNQPERYAVHDAGIDLAVFNNEYSLLATSSWDKTIRFFYYHEFFELGNTIGGGEYIRNLGYRVRSLLFTGNNKLVAGLSDKSIRVWETSSEKLASQICVLLTRDMTTDEWNERVGSVIPYEKTRSIDKFQ